MSHPSHLPQPAPYEKYKTQGTASPPPTSTRLASFILQQRLSKICILALSDDPPPSSGVLVSASLPQPLQLAPLRESCATRPLQRRPTASLFSGRGAAQFAVRSATRPAVTGGAGGRHGRGRLLMALATNTICWTFFFGSDDKG